MYCRNVNRQNGCFVSCGFVFLLPMEGCPLRLFLFPASCVIVGAARWQVLTASVWVLDSRLLVQGWAAIFFYCLGIASRIMRAASCGSFAVASTSLVRVSSKMQVLSGSCYQFPFVYLLPERKIFGAAALLRPRIFLF